ncbi:hypothetical protein [Mesorhizobium caraganae]|uniref:hypothetical protein n=1 Tax=Mesorhizobium caraganae TaxID=483206 RepID=UPI003ECFAC12
MVLAFARSAYAKEVLKAHSLIEMQVNALAFRKDQGIPFSGKMSGKFLVFLNRADKPFAAASINSMQGVTLPVGAIHWYGIGRNGDGGNANANRMFFDLCC